MPDKKERDCWWAFLAGRPESDWNPPKKTKTDANARKRHSYRRDHSPATYPEEDLQSTHETWHINDEGEVELVLSKDPSESLPTPSSTPVPSEPPALDHMHNQGTSYIPPMLKQREPTPTLLAYMDHVSQKLLLRLFPLI
jgi:hypothetical protein